LIYFILKEGWRSFRTLGIGGALTLSALTATLALAALTLEGFLLLSNWNQALLEKFEIEVFLAPDVADDDVDIIAKRIERLEGVTKTLIVTRAEAAERFREQFDSNLLEVLGYNPLPPSIITTLSKSAVKQRKWMELAKQIGNVDGVEDVVYQGELVSEVDRFYNRAGSALIWLIGGALIVSLIFTGMTTSAAIKSRGEFIQAVLMCGGSRMMARGPFIALGGYYGAVGGMVGAGVAAGVSALVTVGWEIEAHFPLEWLPLLATIGILFGGATAGWVAGRKIRQV